MFWSIFGFGRRPFEEASVYLDLCSFGEIGDLINVVPMGWQVIHEEEILYLFELDGEESDPPLLSVLRL